MKVTSHFIGLTNNYDWYMFYGKGTESNKRRLDLQIIQSESYDDQIIKGYVYERDNVDAEPKTGNLNAAILHFRAIVQSDSE